MSEYFGQIHIDCGSVWKVDKPTRNFLLVFKSNKHYVFDSLWKPVVGTSLTTYMFSWNNKKDQVQTGSLTFTTLWAFSADDKMMLFFLFFPENRIWHFMQIVSLGDNLHEMSNPVFWEKETICMKCQILFSGKNKKNISKCRLLKILPRVLSVKQVLKMCYIYKTPLFFPFFLYILPHAREGIL